jgi:hypothetical protein
VTVVGLTKMRRHQSPYSRWALSGVYFIDPWQTV